MQYYSYKNLLHNFLYLNKIRFAMKQVKSCRSEAVANKWLRNNQDKEIIDILLCVTGFAIIYEVPAI